MLKNRFTKIYCIACGKTFVKYVKGVKTFTNNPLGIRPVNALTCSKKCARDYLHIATYGNLITYSNLDSKRVLIKNCENLI